MHKSFRDSLDAQAAALGLDGDRIIQLAKAALDEDLGGGVDATSVATIQPDQISVANFVSRVDGVVAGVIVAKVVVAIACDGNVEFAQDLAEGSPIRRGSRIFSARGQSQGLLLAERSALNFLCHLSGIATLTSHWVAAVEGTGTAVRDTRKTTPGLRDLEKFAVRMGGGTNHRFSLSEAAMIKDNHVVASGGIRQAFKNIRDKFPALPIEVEVDSLEQIAEALEVGADLILLDNMSIGECLEAVQLVAGRARLEASGGITLDTARAYAQTGVNYLAIGALTHSAPNLDIGLDLMVE